MKTIIYLVAVLLAALLVLGCKQSPQAAGQPQLQTGEYDSSKPNSIYSEREFVVANFKVETPTPCYAMTASANREGNKVTFLANIHSTLKEGEECVQMIGSVSSKLKYGPLLKGEYAVSWQANYSDSGVMGIRNGHVTIVI